MLPDETCAPRSVERAFGTVARDCLNAMADERQTENKECFMNGKSETRLNDAWQWSDVPSSAIKVGDGCGKTVLDELGRRYRAALFIRWDEMARQVAKKDSALLRTLFRRWAIQAKGADGQNRNLCP